MIMYQGCHSLSTTRSKKKNTHSWTSSGSSLILLSAVVWIFLGILPFSVPLAYRSVQGEDRFPKWRDHGLTGHVLLPEEQVKTCGHLTRKRDSWKPSCVVHLMQYEKKRWCIVRIRDRFVEKHWVIVSVRVMIWNVLKHCRFRISDCVINLSLPSRGVLLTIHTFENIRVYIEDSHR